MRGVPLFEVGTGAEGAACAGEDSDGKGGLGVEPVVEGMQMVVHGRVDTVEVFGAVDGYEEDRGAGEGEEDVFVCWRR